MGDQDIIIEKMYPYSVLPRKWSRRSGRVWPGVYIKKYRPLPSKDFGCRSCGGPLLQKTLGKTLPYNCFVMIIHVYQSLLMALAFLPFFVLENWVLKKYNCSPHVWNSTTCYTYLLKISVSLLHTTALVLVAVLYSSWVFLLVCSSSVRSFTCHAH